MINTTAKRRRVDSIVRKELLKRGYKNIYMFPHLRFMKDYNVDEMKFDGIATGDSRLLLFQNKSNKKPSRQELEGFRSIGNTYNCDCMWITHIDRKGLMIFK